MAIEDLGKVVTIGASGDLSAKQYYFVTFNASGLIKVAGDGWEAEGVLQNDPDAANRAAAVMVGPGITKVVAGASAAAGDHVGSDSSGRAVKAATGDHVLGIFLEAPGTAGDIVSILFRPFAAKLA